MHIFQLIVEPSSAAGIAAVMSKEFSQFDPTIEKVGIVLCGGNVDIDQLPWNVMQN